MPDRRPMTFLSVAPVTALLMGLCVTYHVFMMVASQNDPQAGGLLGGFSVPALRRFGACYREGVWDGGWQHFVLPMFMHVNLLHILMNMWALYSLGPGAEVHFGRSSFAIIYLLSGLGGVCLSLLTTEVTMAGASGALFGLMGAWLAVKVIACWDWRRAVRNSEVRQVAFTIALNFGICMLLPNISNAGHFGGLLFGFAFGCFFEYWRKHQRVGLALLVLIFSLPVAGVAASRWMVWSPHYCVHLGLRVEEREQPESAAARFAEARAWAKRWRSEGAAWELADAYNAALNAGETNRAHRYLDLLSDVAPLPWIAQHQIEERRAFFGPVKEGEREPP